MNGVWALGILHWFWLATHELRFWLAQQETWLWVHDPTRLR